MVAGRMGRETLRERGRGRDRRERKNSEKEEVPGLEPHPRLFTCRVTFFWVFIPISPRLPHWDTHPST